MAISDRIRAEAKRTIDGIVRYYEKYGEDHEDAEEKEHRIARIESAMEGCNGLSGEDKIQKTAENLFELTCAQERTFDSVRKEIRNLREENNGEFDLLRKELGEGLADIIRKIDSGHGGGKPVLAHEGSGGTPDKGPFPSVDIAHANIVAKVISDHPLLSFYTFVFFIVVIFVSGHFNVLLKLIGK